ncbi:hypothetical protein Nepgr_021834 [Nepenthes gracilis]|uniref:NAB domain-containing protein n=1 Tax=Nepenthes gracilis TaxID=150966 RepID=A0AAD3XWE7_NEPGR|nr:hypothetical protein Nepgr_021834 [Nepenthes gracilis]
MFFGVPKQPLVASEQEKLIFNFLGWRRKNGVKTEKCSWGFNTSSCCSEIPSSFPSIVPFFLFVNFVMESWINGYKGLDPELQSLIQKFIAIMSTMLHSESRRLYSWWWDSHISPKNSKWLQENLTDMDAKVKAMIKLIEEDADSFARRAEMYYEKRPELIKLVEEFYRAYRALAERYNHATGELRHAQQTLTKAFPNQVPFPHTPLTDLPTHALIDSDGSPIDASGVSLSYNFNGIERNGTYTEESGDVVRKRGLKQLNEMFQPDVVVHVLKTAEGTSRGAMNLHEEDEKGRSLADLEGDFALFANENQNLKTRICNEHERAGRAETKLQTMKEVLAKVEAERDAVFLQYQQNMEKLSNLEKELSLAQNNARELNRQASTAEAEIKSLKDALVKSQAERDDNLLQYRESLNRVGTLETAIFTAQENERRSSERVGKAEMESQNLKQELSRLEDEKEAGCRLYEQCLEKISVLENKICLAEEKAKVLNGQANKAKNQVEVLEEELLKLNEEKEDVTLRYKQSLEIISKLQNELTDAQEEARRLNIEILLGSAQLKGAEELCALLRKMNLSLQTEADNLLSWRNFIIRLQEENGRFVQVEATLHALQNLHSQSQEEQRAMAVELRNGLLIWKNLDMSKRDLEVEIQQLREKNRSLNDLNLSYSISENNLHNEISGLREIKEKLEGELRGQAEKIDAFQQQVRHLEKEMEDLFKRYQALIQQVEYVGLDLECIGSSVKDLQEENSRLKGSCSKDSAEKGVLLKKLEHMEELLRKSSIFESSLSDMSAELERSKEKVRTLQESCLLLNGEKSTLIAEQAALFSQLQIVNESMQKILENNAWLENSLVSANAEVEGLRAKSNSLEEFCQLLNNERSNLVTERSTLGSRLENVERKVESLESKFTKLEDKYAGLEKEKESTLSKYEELRVSIAMEKQECACLVMTSEARLSGLEDHIHHLQEENRCRKEFEEQLDKAVNAHVEIFILQKFIKDMEEKNYSLLLQCQKHVEAAKYSEELIAEFEGENMMQQVEREFLLDRIDKLRTGICQVIKALGINHIKETEQEQNYIPCILSNIRDISSSLLVARDENQHLAIENYILTTMLRQLNLEGTELVSRKEALDWEFLILSQHHAMLEDEKLELLEKSRYLEMEMAERVKREQSMKTEMERLYIEEGGMQMAYAVLQEENLKALEENCCFRKELSDLKEEKCKLEEEKNTAFLENLDFGIRVVIFKSYGIEKTLELETASQDVDHLSKACSDLEKRVKELAAKLEMKDMENLHLRESVKKLEERQHELNCCNDQLDQQILVQQELLDQKKTELSELQQELRDLQAKNTELYRIVEVADKEHVDSDVKGEMLEKQILELSKLCKSQDEKIEHLHQSNQKLQCELGLLQEESEEYKIREVILSSELHERSSEFELWEAEAALFYFDLQISGIREILFENKVQELSGICEGLEVMKEKVGFLETEAEGLKTQLAAYVPIIASLKDNITSLEQNPAVLTKHHPDFGAEEQVAGETSFQEQGDQSSSAPDGLSELQKLQNRIKVIENILMEERDRVGLQECPNDDVKLNAAMKEIEELRSRLSASQNIHNIEWEYGDPCSGILKSPDFGSETSEGRNGTLMKDIPLDQASDGSSYGNSRRQNGLLDDQMIKLWEITNCDLTASKTRQQASVSEYDILYQEFEIVEQNNLNAPSESPTEKGLVVDKMEVLKSGSSSDQERNKKNIIERLASDAQKLMDLQILVQELRMKMDTIKKRKSSTDVEYDKLRSQLQDFENSVMQLLDTNTEMLKTIEDRHLTSNAEASAELEEAKCAQRKRVSELARKGSERIGSLQLEMQNIQYVLLKLGDEKNKGRSRFSRSHTGILLRNFMQRRGRSRRQKKARFCGCLRPPSMEN